MAIIISNISIIIQTLRRLEPHPYLRLMILNLYNEFPCPSLVYPSPIVSFCYPFHVLFLDLPSHFLVFPIITFRPLIFNSNYTLIYLNNYFNYNHYNYHSNSNNNNNNIIIYSSSTPGSMLLVIHLSTLTIILNINTLH